MLFMLAFLLCSGWISCCYGCCVCGRCRHRRLGDMLGCEFCDGGWLMVVVRSWVVVLLAIDMSESVLMGSVKTLDGVVV